MSASPTASWKIRRELIVARFQNARLDNAGRRARLGGGVGVQEGRRWTPAEVVAGGDGGGGAAAGGVASRAARTARLGPESGESAARAAARVQLRGLPVRLLGHGAVDGAGLLRSTVFAINMRGVRRRDGGFCKGVIDLVAGISWRKFRFYWQGVGGSEFLGFFWNCEVSRCDSDHCGGAIF